MANVLAVEWSVVIPVRDEAENIIPLTTDVVAALKDLSSFEILYVDDGSCDATPKKLLEAKVICPSLRIIRHRASCGQSQAIYTGVRHARGMWIVTLDGDGQNDPADIPTLITHHREAVARSGLAPSSLMVAGHRHDRKDTLLKSWSSRVANAVRASLLKDKTPDTGCGLKLFAREVFLRFPRFDHMHRYLPALMLREGGTVVSVSVNHRPRKRGRSHYGVWDRLWVGITDLVGVIWLQRRVKNPVIDIED